MCSGRLRRDIFCLGAVLGGVGERGVLDIGEGEGDSTLAVIFILRIVLGTDSDRSVCLQM